MTKLIAKPIVKDQYWVVTDGTKKVGNVVADGGGIEVKINGQGSHFQSIADIKDKIQITFEPVNGSNAKTTVPYPEFPTTPRTYNSMFDIKRKLHLFTKLKKSKCYYAAGWFVVDLNGSKQTMFCPKYIFIQRYEYEGPFKTEDEANIHINTV